MRGGGEDLRGGLGEGLSVVEEGEGVDVVLGEGVGAGDGEGPGGFVLACGSFLGMRGVSVRVASCLLTSAR